MKLTFEPSGQNTMDNLGRLYAAWRMKAKTGPNSIDATSGQVLASTSSIVTAASRDLSRPASTVVRSLVSVTPKSTQSLLDID